MNYGKRRAILFGNVTEYLVTCWTAFKAGGTGEPAAPYLARFLGALPPDLPALFPSEDTGSPACSMPCGGQEAGPPAELRSLVGPARENDETQVRRGVGYHGPHGFSQSPLSTQNTES